MDFRESLEFLYGLQLFGIKLGLENTRMLLERSGHPERCYPCVHVAGTNGKGSVCAMLAAILQQAGWRVGLYTSPHLQSFTERIRINGVPISEAEVVALTEELRIAAPEVAATFFEFTTVLALLSFARHQVDVAIVETGLGGRLDATNVVQPLLTVITPISLDHEEQLGPNLAAIATEKAGILKRNTPVIVGRQEPAAQRILLQRAAELQVTVQLFGRDFSVQAGSGAAVSVRCADGMVADLYPSLVGEHQHDNLACAVAAARQLRICGQPVPESAIRTGVATTRWPGRLEWWGQKRQVLLDGAHNPAGAAALADFLRRQPCGGVRWVVAIKDDKNHEEICAALLPLMTKVYATTLTECPSVAPAALVALATATGCAAEASATLETALRTALAECRPGEVVLVAGSLYLVGAARTWLQQEAA